jgi:hypothetical protein
MFHCPKRIERPESSQEEEGRELHEVFAGLQSKAGPRQSQSVTVQR